MPGVGFAPGLEVVLSVENNPCGGNDRLWGFNAAELNSLSRGTEFVLTGDEYYN